MAASASSSANAIKTLQGAIAVIQKSMITGVIGGKNISEFVSYSGGLLNGVPEGQGVGSRKDGIVFSGTFKNGYLHGQGEGTDKNGTYKGMYVNGTMHGQGKLTIGYKVLEGIFSNGLLNGKGKTTINGKVIQEGMYVNGNLHGQGEITTIGWNNSSYVYTGMFFMEKLHGLGKITLNGKVLKEGTFSHGELHGHGKNIKGNIIEAGLSNGDIYEGMFVNGASNGMMKVTRRGKVTYETYINGVLQDYKIASPPAYESIPAAAASNYAPNGIFMNGQLHGQGKITAPNGIFMNGQLNDQGKRTAPAMTAAATSSHNVASVVNSGVDAAMTVPTAVLVSGEKRKKCDSVELTGKDDNDEDISPKRVKIEGAENLFGFRAAASSSSSQ